MREKSVLKAYFLWLVLGLFGAHHFYLRRDRHAFVWFCTLGGLILGWVRDFWHLPRYTRDSCHQADGYTNDDNHDHWHDYSHQYQANRTPPTASLARLGGMAAVGYLYGYLIFFSYPPFFTPLQGYAVPLRKMGKLRLANVEPAITCLQFALLSMAVAFGKFSSISCIVNDKINKQNSTV
jgi:hypothetical protein